MIPGHNSPHQSLRKSFLFAAQGFRFALETERNIKIMLVFGIVVVAAGFICSLTVLEWVAILICCGMVMAAELINTAIETVVDLVSPEFHPLAGRAKDIAAAASWLLSIISACVGLLVFGSALMRLIG